MENRLKLLGRCVIAFCLTFAIRLCMPEISQGEFFIIYLLILADLERKINVDKP